MKRSILYALLALALILVASRTLAAVEDFSLPWWTVDGGGGRSEGGGFVLHGTAGQPDAGLLTGPGYTLGGGFWTGGELAPAGHAIYLPMVLR